MRCRQLSRSGVKGDKTLQVKGIRGEFDLLGRMFTFEWDANSVLRIYPFSTWEDAKGFLEYGMKQESQPSPVPMAEPRPAKYKKNGTPPPETQLPWDDAQPEPVADLNPPDETPATNTEIPEDIRKATQLRIVIEWLQKNGFETEEQLITELERIAETDDADGKPLIPHVSRIKNIPDQVKRQLLIMA